MSERTTVVNLRHDSYDVYIGRPSKWGNPFVIGRDGTRTAVVRKYAAYLRRSPHLIDSLEEIRGRRLGCYCKPDECHGDVLARVADCTHMGTDDCEVCSD